MGVDYKFLLSMVIGPKPAYKKDSCPHAGPGVFSPHFNSFCSNQMLASATVTQYLTSSLFILFYFFRSSVYLYLKNYLV